MENKIDKCEIIEEAWNVLIVDNNSCVHRMIKELNKNRRFENKKINFLSAYSKEEAKKILDKNNNIGLIILDAFLSGSDLGLGLVKYIRKDIKNVDMRIVIMTDNSSDILEEEIVLNYDINGYGDKSGLFFGKSSTIILSALRGYRDIRRLKINREAMESVVKSMSEIHNESGLNSFLINSLCRLSSVINQCVGVGKYNCSIDSLAAVKIENSNKFRIVGARGKYKYKIDKTIAESVDRETYIKANNIYINGDNKEGDHKLFNDSYIAKYKSSSGDEAIIIIENNRNREHVDVELLNVFHKSISASYDNLCLNIEIEETQKEILYILAEVTEARSEVTGFHVKRVSKYCKILAKEYGLTQREVILLTYAAPIHDIGKVAVPDSILLKPGKLTKEEFDIVKTHTTIGYNLLKNSNRDILKTAAIVAHEHHERYDGTGYPRGLKGDDIHIFGRIAAVADVFDALGSARVYKKAWDTKRILNYFKEERGKQFDPVLVDILFKNLDKFLEIKRKYKDENKFYPFKN